MADDEEEDIENGYDVLEEFQAYSDSETESSSSDGKIIVELYFCPKVTVFLCKISAWLMKNIVRFYEEFSFNFDVKFIERKCWI